MVTSVKTTANSLSVGTGSSRVILGANSGSLTVTDPSSNVTQIVPGVALTTDTSDYLEVANAAALIANNTTKYLQVANATALVANNTTKYLEVANASVYLEVANAGGGSISSLSDVANTGFSNAEILIFDGTNFKSSANSNQGVRIGNIGISTYRNGLFFLDQPTNTTWNRSGTGPYNVVIDPGRAAPPNSEGIVAIGYEAGGSIGDYSVAIGNYAGKNQTGGSNIFLGASAGYTGTSGSGTDNVGIGRSALSRISTGSTNVGFGRGSGARITSGSHNTVVGGGLSGGSGVTGNYNIAIGSYTASYHSSGSHTITMGYLTGYYSYAMSKSIMIGSYAGYNATGDQNILIGYNSGKTSGNLTTGQKNTLVGSDTGGITTGNNNVVIGASATASATGVANEITLGDSNIATIRAQVTSITALSDERDKTNITDIPVGLDFVEEMRPVKFDWNRRDGSKQGEGQIGFIAQDLQSLERDYGVEQYTQLVYNSNPEKLEATPLNAFPILVKAVQELSEKVDRLQAQINDM